MSEIETAFSPIRAVHHRNYFPKTTSFYAGGGFAPIGRQYLLTTADGDLYTFKEAEESDGLVVSRLPQVVPLNRERFVAKSGEGGFTHWFRVMDLLVQEMGEDVRVFASHHYWRDDEQCFVVRVSMLEETRETVLTANQPLDWWTLYETEPCLPLKDEEWPFRGMDGGGRMAMLSPDSLLVTIGDQGFNGSDFSPDFVRDANASYGKSIIIDIPSEVSNIYSVGHRNPQGLWVDASGSIWLTDHGPRGGDELNLMVRGEDYGWPRVTYGTAYGSFAWPLNPSQGRHEGYIKPIYAWLPSIAVSNLLVVQEDRFPSWQGDLLVASLLGEALWRLRVDDDHVVFAEQIAIGARIRDLAEDKQGRIILWTDDYSIVTLEPTNPGAFVACAGCHEVRDGSVHGIGPDLWGIVGRSVAAAPAYGYSEALKSLEGEWTEARLDEFLRDPRSVTPGTSMIFEGIRDSASRSEIIGYLKTLR